MSTLKSEKQKKKVAFHHGVTTAPDASAFERHCHGGYELLYARKGRGSYMVEGAEYPLEADTLLFLRPYEYHYVCPQRDCEYERYVINFDAELLSESTFSLPLFKRYTAGVGTGVYFPAGSVDPAVRSAFEMLDVAERLQRQAEATDGDGRENERLIDLIGTVANQVLLLLSLSGGDLPEQPKEENTVYKVISYLNRHLGEEIALDELASRFYISKYYLCRAFRRYTGTTVFSYLTSKRIIAAKEWIASGVPSAEAAFRAGFRDYSAFYRAYRKETGRAPIHSRKAR